MTTIFSMFFDFSVPTQRNTTRWEPKTFRQTHDAYLRMDCPRLDFATKYGQKYGLSSTANCIPRQTLSFTYVWDSSNSTFRTFGQTFVAKSSLGRSLRRYIPWVWRKDFGSHLVVFRCGLSLRVGIGARNAVFIRAYRRILTGIKTWVPNMRYIPTKYKVND